ncbi:hypothetical protein [uncultured Roseobacter sp.]|uniref:hypothetical protein n=1 Tax=uncultured Roseobacter sp. TaxID=114847 RepID=UPI0026202EB4|nr:hypothetical protein [uncultured Roseobacter sp.]
MGLSDDPLPTPMQARRNVAVSADDLRPGNQGYSFPAITGIAYFMAALVGALMGKISGLWFDPYWQRVFVVIGVVGLPAFLWWSSRRRAKKYARMDAEAQYRRQAEEREYRERQIEEARARGDFDRWKNDE